MKAKTFCCRFVLKNFQEAHGVKHVKYLEGEWGGGRDLIGRMKISEAKTCGSSSSEIYIM
jgi:hypothetical protein